MIAGPASMWKPTFPCALHPRSTVLVVVLAATVAIAATTGVGVASSWFDEQRILLAFALALVAVPMLGRMGGAVGRVPVILTVALALGSVSVALASRPAAALTEWSVLALLIVLVVYVRPASRTTLESISGLSVTVVAGAYVAGVAANYVSALLLDGPVGAETLLVGFSNPRFPAQLQALTIPLLPLAYYRAPSSFWRRGVSVVAALWWMCFLGSGSRTGWIAMAVAAVVVTSLVIEGRRWLKWQITFAVAGGLLWFLLFHALPAVLGIESHPETDRLSNFASVAARWDLWRLSIEYALANPWLGVGPMHFAYIDNGLGAHPHNFWLQLLAEWGIPATLLIGGATIGLVAGMWRRLRTETDSESRSVGVALFAAVIAWCVGTLSDGYMVIPTSQAMSTVVLMLAVMWLRLGTPVPAPSTANRVASVVMVAFTVIALVVLASLPFTDFGQPTRREQLWRAEHPGQILWPRFWQQGWIGPDADPTARPAGGVPKPSR